MEGRRRRNNNNNNNNYRRSQNKRPPVGNWQPVVPKWEKKFCKVIGLLDWETLLQMKKFAHLYENVINWDDSAGEEAFSNAKKRFWAEINGLFCHLPPPDPDLYIDKIDWDLETDNELISDVETETINSNTDENHDPVVILGDSLFPNQAYSLSGWGDEEKVLKGPDNNITSLDHGDHWEQNGDSSFGNGAAIVSPGGSNHEWNRNHANSNTIYGAGPTTRWILTGP
ncbi:hypothetical protein OROHE_026574 [Orobanche hederae]